MHKQETWDEIEFMLNPVQNLSFEAHWACVYFFGTVLKLRIINGPNTGFWWVQSTLTFNQLYK